MTITYTLEESDFLTYQLFAASKSKSSRRRRWRAIVLVPLLYWLMGGVLLLRGMEVTGVAIMVAGALWLVLYPFFQRWRYVRHYRSYIREHYRERCGREVALELTDDFLRSWDHGSESKVMASELAEMHEIPTLILIKLKSGQSYIIPKSRIADLDQVKGKLKELATRRGIPYRLDEDWKWK